MTQKIKTSFKKTNYHWHKWN